MPKTGRPKSENPKTDEIRVQIEPDIKVRFFDKCKDEGVIASALIRKWILEFLENKKK